MDLKARHTRRLIECKNRQHMYEVIRYIQQKQTTNVLEFYVHSCVVVVGS